MQAAIWVIELGVGLACLAGGVMVFRTQRMRVVGILLVLAGGAAAGHAVVRLSGN